MATIKLTYAALASRLGITASGARKTARRRRWNVIRSGTDIRVAVTPEQIRDARQGRPSGGSKPKSSGKRVRMSLDALARKLGVTHDAARKTAYRHGWRIDPDPRKQPTGFKVNPARIVVMVDPTYGRGA